MSQVTKLEMTELFVCATSTSHPTGRSSEPITGMALSSPVVTMPSSGTAPGDPPEALLEEMSLFSEIHLGGLLGLLLLFHPKCACE